MSLFRALADDQAPAGRELSRAAAGHHEAVLARDAFPCDIERGSVIDRNPDDGQANRDVHPVVAVDGFERRVSLIVVTDDDDAPLAGTAAGMSASAGSGPRTFKPRAVARATAGPSTPTVPRVSEKATFTCVRIQAGKPMGSSGQPSALAKAPARFRISSVRCGVMCSIAILNETCVVR